ncbi:hypothetical protein B0H19DRAFT_1335112 [Mycena capillaripes]|nr:hypothetical protein B0H19DRAFT_1335112 [Mycena capillaripes]
MHTLVDAIPLLLHASLVFFLADLVAFLIPINVLMVAVVATLLTVVMAVYFTHPLLPLRHLDCPYRTPLSTAFWRISQAIMMVWRRRRGVVASGPSPADPPLAETMVEAMSRHAMEVSPAHTITGPSCGPSDHSPTISSWNHSSRVCRACYGAPYEGDTHTTRASRD